MRPDVAAGADFLRRNPPDRAFNLHDPGEALARAAHGAAQRPFGRAHWRAPPGSSYWSAMMALDDPDQAADAALLAAYAAGDRAAARQLVEAYGPLAHRLAVRMLGAGAEAEDVAQEAMVRLWRIAPEWREGEARISTWLYRVTANLCTDRLRRRQRRQEDWPEGFDPPDDDRPTAEARLQEAARNSALDRAIAGLPERQRLAVVLRHLEERSNPEVAEILGVSVEAVESLLSRGRRALKDALYGAAEELGYKDG